MLRKWQGVSSSSVDFGTALLATCDCRRLLRRRLDAFAKFRELRNRHRQMPPDRDLAEQRLHRRDLARRHVAERRQIRRDGREIAIRGHLPVSIPELAKLGEGIEAPAKK